VSGLFDRLAGHGLVGNTHASLVLLADRLTSNYLGHQTLDAFIDPFHAFFSVANSGAAKVFSLRRTLHAVRASLFAKALLQSANPIAWTTLGLAARQIS